MKKTNSKKKGKKKSKIEEKEETKLEEEIKQAEKEIEEKEFFEEPVRQIPISAEIKAPVLERIIERQTIPLQNPVETEAERRAGEGRIDYSPASNEPNYGFTRNIREDEEKKYETSFIPPVLTRREISENEIRQEFLKQPAESWSNRIDESQLNKIDFIEEGTKLPFEEQKKYKRFKLR